MLAIEVELLTDRYVATHFNDRGRAEWPPHPARLYSAMVATWADHDAPDEAERDVLAQFAALGAPAVTHSAAGYRESVTHYVPVNDAAVVRDLSGLYGKVADLEAAYAAALTEAAGDLDDRRVRRAAKAQEKQRAKAVDDSRKAARPGAPMSALDILPDQRTKQGRFYPCVVPETPRFYFVWPEAELDEQQCGVLDGVLARVSRLGHSSSFVACRLVDDAPAPTLIPDPAGADELLRVTTPGLLDRLEAAFDRHQGREPRALPARMTRYAAVDPTARPAAVPRPHLSGSWIVLAREDGPMLPVRRSLVLARGVRDALLHHAEEPIPALLSGHVQGAAGDRTGPTSRPHLAVVPLSFVGGGHGDGSLLGVTLILPTEASPKERQALLRAVGRWRENGFQLWLGAAGLLRLAVADPADTRATLDRRTWCRPSRDWVSVTPVALDRHPGDLWSARPDKRERAHAEARETMLAACENAGLPRPLHVELSREPLLRGTAPAPRYDKFSGGGGPQRYLVHASLTFAESVAGPVLLGAGRFLGYGLFRPMRRRNDAGDARG